MQKSIWRKTASSVTVVAFLIVGLFIAKLIASMIDWFIPLTYDQIDMIVYLLYVGWLFSIAYYYAP